MESKSEIIQMKPTRSYLNCSTVYHEMKGNSRTIESKHEILKCNHSKESY